MTPIQNRTEILDLEAALRFHSTKQTLKQQAEKIRHSCHTYLATIEEAIELGDAQKLEEFARLLTNLLTTLSPPAALDLALQLERQGRSNTLTETQQTIRCLQVELDRLHKTIADL